MRRTAALLWRGEPLVLTLLFIGLWELFSRSGVVPRHSFPPATTIFRAFVEDVQHAAIWGGVVASLKAWAIGLIIVVVVAIPVGLLLGMSNLAYRAIRPTLDFVRTVPSIAALPILLFLYGIDIRLTVTLVALAAVWPLLIQSMYGAHDVDPVSLDTGRIYGLGRVRLFFKVALPGAMPYIVTGLRISAVIALLVAVAASIIVGGEGIGEQIESARRNDQPDLVYARVVLTSLLGLVVTYTLLRMERWVLRWHVSQREAE